MSAADARLVRVVDGRAVVERVAVYVREGSEPPREVYAVAYSSTILWGGDEPVGPPSTDRIRFRRVGGASPDGSYLYLEER